MDMLLTSRVAFQNEPDVDKSKIVMLTELTLNDLGSEGNIDERNTSTGPILFVRWGRRYSSPTICYRLTDYLARTTEVLASRDHHGYLCAARRSLKRHYNSNLRADFWRVLHPCLAQM